MVEIRNQTQWATAFVLQGSAIVILQNLVNLIAFAAVSGAIFVAGDTAVELIAVVHWHQDAGDPTLNALEIVKFLEAVLAARLCILIFVNIVAIRAHDQRWREFWFATILVTLGRLLLMTIDAVVEIKAVHAAQFAV